MYPLYVMNENVDADAERTYTSVSIFPKENVVPSEATPPENLMVLHSVYGKELMAKLLDALRQDVELVPLIVPHQYTKGLALLNPAPRLDGAR